MATNVTVQLDPFKRGDTPTFDFSYSNPYVGFDWSGITLDAAMTDLTAPADNTGAAATRLAQSMVVDSQGAHYNFTLTVAESKLLVVGAKYFIEAQLKQGTTSVATPATATVKVLQDYVV
jgi:hypothetical protein